jgi:hypothetical protein
MQRKRKRPKGGFLSVSDINLNGKEKRMKLGEIMRGMEAGNIPYVRMETGLKMPVAQSVLDRLGMLSGDPMDGLNLSSIMVESYQEIIEVQQQLELQAIKPKDFEEGA